MNTQQRQPKIIKQPFLYAGADFNMDDTVVEEAMAIARAYREASEADTMDMLNAQSKTGLADGSTVLFQSNGSVRYEKMKYYLVSAPWLRKAWRHVLKPPPRVSKDWREIVDCIDNSSLVETKASSSVSQHQQQSAGDPTNGDDGPNGSYTLRKDMLHEKHFYLVGSHAWLLLSKKFGCTHELSAVVRVHKRNESSLVVDPHSSGPLYLSSVSNGHSGLIPIPASGRFPYATNLDDGLADTFEDNAMRNPQDDEGPFHSTFNQKASVHIIPSHVASGDRQQVSDDSDNEQDISTGMMKDAPSDGALGGEDLSISSQQQGGVLLLPPSTTFAATKESSLYSPIGKSRAGVGTTAIDDDFGFSPTNNNASTNHGDDYWAMDSDNVGSAPSLRSITTLNRFRYGSGLGNLGNTCFMNSTLQCLGHTQPLQKYFLSGEFRRELNRVNPLGTGGELALAFADLMTEMWSQETKTVVGKSALEQGSNNVRWSPSTGHVVYPREFKYIVGKHAEQFMGYEQHDSQEFATYLLDALHEDTNRISKKPYIEKPEQEDGESDREAADKAWDLHRKREDSRVSDNFMGQVKSRVQCCEPGCGRVSTTFDPFMYLSVPIPGSSERTLAIHYVPLDPAKRVQSLSITLPKTGTIQELAKRTRDQVLKLGVEKELLAEDMCVVDMWQKEIYSWYNLTDEIDRIRDTDETFVYALRPSSEIAALSKEKAKDGDSELGMCNMKDSQPKRYQLDLATITRLNTGDKWTEEYAKYLCNHLGFLNAFNPSKGTTDDRVKLYQRTTTFLEQCYNEIKDLDVVDNARKVNDDEIPDLMARCDCSPVFENVRSLQDLAILEFCAAKMRAEILRLIRAKKDESPGGIKISIRMKSSGGAPASRSQYFCNPLVLRISSDMTVYGLREVLAKRLFRSLRRPGETRTVNEKMSGESTSESNGTTEPSRFQGASREFGDNSFGSPELLIMRQIPLSYDRKNPGYSVKSYDNSSQLGSLEKDRGFRRVDSRRVPMASPKDHEENHIVAHIVGDQGMVNLEWTDELIERVFDTEEYEAVDDSAARSTEDEENVPVTRARKAKTTTSVLDCIEKYCQMEQLEETEMWYCNRCQKHVRAWKQFDLYRTPPILIVHLKRFHYSATTHRRDKINLFIDFPLEGLDLTEHVMHWTEDEKPIYDCYAVSNHYGGLGGGHYTAHALNDDGVWCYYDDSRVNTDVDKRSIISEAAYVLYYRRRDVPVDENFLLNLQTPEPSGPAIIADVPDSKVASTSSEISGSNAAVVDDDNMDVEDTCSHCTSVGSMVPVDDYEEVEHIYPDTDDPLPNDEGVGPARQ